jgi:hypothetical protein
MASWHFQKHNGYGDIDQTSSAEAFSGSSIRDLATALVREGIQNVIDARGSHNGNGPARVRLSIGTCAAEPEVINDRWFGKLEKHLKEPDVGAPDAPVNGEPCRYLVFEDFGTKGLTGDYAAPYKPGQENNFVNFMYHDGVTGKAESKLGSRGVGKIVFTMASRVRTIFAYTIREDDPARQPLLVGKNLLKFREIEGELYAGRSYFLDSWPDNQARQPVTDPQTLYHFANDFPIMRKDEPGLSIVIPFIDISVTREQLSRAIIEEYHYAILSGQLDVELDDHGEKDVFTASHVPRINDPEVNAHVDLARWAISHGSNGLRTQAPQPGELQRLTESLVGDDAREALNEALNRRTRAAVRLQLYIHPKNSEPVLTEFEAYVEFADRSHAKPVFVRELLPISDVREARPVPQVRSLVIVRPGPLADLLRAAEGANHTDWSPRNDRFQERYRGRLGEISFVALSINRLIEIVRGQANEPVGGIATQFFSVMKLKQTVMTPDKSHEKSGSDSEEVPDNLDPPPKSSYLLTRTDDGFTVRHNAGQPLAARITIRTAYDVLRGSPWADYDPADFDFRKSKGDVSVLTHDVELTRKDPGNRLVLAPRSEKFELVVTGFDPNRDLIIDHRDTSKADRKRKEKQDADSENQLHEPKTTDA